MLMKFPKYYKDAALLLKKASEEDINVKNLLFNDKKYQHYNIKSLFAIVTKALQNWDVIEKLMKDSNILTEHTGLDIWRIRVIITELLFGKKAFPNAENYTLATVVQYEDQFKKILSKKHVKALIGSNAKDDVAKVRFVKVNLIKDNVKCVIERFQEDGWEKLETASNYKDYQQQLRDLEQKSSVFLQDFHFPEVLVFPPGTELQDHELYINGSVLFMDKASCLAPFLLAPKQNSHVLDMCAAPGLKTIQLASYVKSGKVYAVERDNERFNTLQMMVEQSGADNVTTILQDVTTLNVEQYNHVEYILVDPSCTGSGIRKRQPSATLKERLDEKTRLEKLSGFQLILLRFALTRFPAAKRVVYSTCSLNVEENEKVVEAALNGFNDNFHVVSVQDKLSGWQNFGSKDFQFGSNCIYCRPEIDQTNGFFVAVFERRERSSESVNSNSQISNERSENQFKGRKRRIHEEDNDGNDYLEKSHKRRKESNQRETYKGNELVSTNSFDNGEIQKVKARRIHEEYYDENDYLKKSRKRYKESNQRETYKENEVFSTNSFNNGETHKVKAKVKKLSLSEKKRSRKKMLKIRNKLYPKSPKNKNVESKLKSDVLKDLVEKPNSNKENCKKISKAKLRYKRLKNFKLKSSTEIDTNNVQRLSEVSNSLPSKLNTEDTKKLKEREKNDNPLQVSQDLESGNISVLKKQKKRKGKFTDLNGFEGAQTENGDVNITSDKHIEENCRNEGRSGKSLCEDSTEFIKENESRKPSKKKHKTNHSLGHQNTYTNNDLNDKDSADKLDNLVTSCQRTKEKDSISSENVIVGLKNEKQKRKHSFTLNEENDSSIVNNCGNLSSATYAVGKEKKSKETNENIEEGEGEILEKIQKKKHLSDHCDSSSINHDKYNECVKNIDLFCQNTEDISTIDSIKQKLRKKHKKKHSSDSYDSNITDNFQDKESFNASMRDKTEEDINDTSNKGACKKKHKKKHSSDESNIGHEQVGENFDTNDDVLYIKSSEEGAHKKKHKKKILNR